MLGLYRVIISETLLTFAFTVWEETQITLLMMNGTRLLD